MREETDASAEEVCDALLVQYGSVDGGSPELPGWRVQWSGGRRGDATERYVLYVKDRTT